MTSPVFGDSFDNCLDNLSQVLQRCEETNLVLNWEKCHFMVKDGIVLGHKISTGGLEVDKAKIIAIEQLPPPSNEKGVRSFLDMPASTGVLSEIFQRLLNLFVIC